MISRAIAQRSWNAGAATDAAEGPSRLQGEGLQPYELHYMSCITVAGMSCLRCCHGVTDNVAPSQTSMTTLPGWCCPLRHSITWMLGRGRKSWCRTCQMCRCCSASQARKHWMRLLGKVRQPVSRSATLPHQTSGFIAHVLCGFHISSPFCFASLQVPKQCHQL